MSGRDCDIAIVVTTATMPNPAATTVRVLFIIKIKIRKAAL